MFSVGLKYVFRVGLRLIYGWFRAYSVFFFFSWVQGWFRLVLGWFRVCVVLV